MTDTCRPLALHTLTHHIYNHTADTFRTACSSAQRSLSFKSARSPRGSISSYGFNQQRQKQRDQQALINSSLIGISTAPGYFDQTWASIINSTTSETKFPSKAAGVTTSQIGESLSTPSSPGSCTCIAPCIPFSPTSEDFTTCLCRDNAIQPDVSSLVNLSNNPSQYSLGHYDSSENGPSLSLKHKASRASLAGTATPAEIPDAIDEFWNKSTTRKPAPAAEWDYEALMSSSHGFDQDMDCDHTTSTIENSLSSVQPCDVEMESAALDRVWSVLEHSDTVAAEVARRIMSQRAAERLNCVIGHLK